MRAEKVRMDVSIRETEEASMEPILSSTSSTLALSLGKVKVSNEENATIKKFAPVFSAPKWAKKSRKIVTVAMLL